jgi:competence protein ComEC
MLLEKPELFRSRKEALVVLGTMLLILSLRLYNIYGEYIEFIDKPFYYTKATILNQYTKSKNGREYEVLKMATDNGYTIYTTAHLKRDLTNYRVRVKLIPDSGIKFGEYLGSFFIKVVIKKVYKKIETKRDTLLLNIASQHKDNKIISFYQAIFLATPLDKALREKIAILGVSHLVALSGFHLGILWGLIYGIVLLVYQPLQQRYFTYRYSLIDIGTITILILGYYLWFVGSPPSLVRSYAMMSIGWVVLLFGIRLVSFEFLGVVTLLLLVLLPTLVVSIGFWFSIAGVFYIFLILHWSIKFHKLIISLLFIPIGIFLLMLPIVHTIFGVTSYYQLLSPLLSLLFIPFYPLSIGLHLFGVGGVMDSGLLWLFGMANGSVEMILPWEYTIGYALLSLGATRFFWLSVLTLISAFLYMGYLFFDLSLF